jgi:hypothetical protein
MRPQAEKHFLRHIFSQDAVAKHAPGKSHNPPQVAVNQLTARRVVSSLDLKHQRLIGVIDHCFCFANTPRDV